MTERHIEEPTRWLVIAALPRTGSNYLCERISLLEMCGAPREYLLPSDRERYDTEFGLDPGLALGDYIDAVGRATRSASHGVASLKIMDSHWEEVGTELGGSLHQQLAEPRYVMLTRRNRAAQAISLSKAMQSQAWMSYSDPEAAPQYDYSQLIEALGWIETGVQRWRTTFEQYGVTPVELTYEELLADLEGSLWKVLEQTFGSDFDPKTLSEATNTNRGALRVQRDAQSAEWEARLRDELAEHGSEHLLSE